MSYIVLRTETPLHERSLLGLAKDLDMAYPTLWNAFHRAPVSSKFVARTLLAFPHLRFDELFEVKRIAPPLLETEGKMGRPRKNPDAPAIHLQKRFPQMAPDTREPGPKSVKEPLHRLADYKGFPTTLEAALAHAEREPAGSGGELTAADNMADGTDAVPLPHVELLLDDSAWVCRFFEDGTIQCNTDISSGFLASLLDAYDLVNVPGSGWIRP